MINRIHPVQYLCTAPSKSPDETSLHMNPNVNNQSVTIQRKIKFSFNPPLQPSPTSSTFDIFLEPHSFQDIVVPALNIKNK